MRCRFSLPLVTFFVGWRWSRQMNDSRRRRPCVPPALFRLAGHGSGCRGRAPAAGPARQRRWPWAPGCGSSGAGSKGQGSLVVGCRRAKPLTLGGSGEQGAPDCRSRAARRGRASNRRTVGQVSRGGTPFGVGAGARKLLPGDATGAVPPCQVERRSRVARDTRAQLATPRRQQIAHEPPLSAARFRVERFARKIFESSH